MKSTASKTLALTATVALAISGISTTAKAGPECDPLVHSAQQLVGLLTNLKEDFRQHYVHTPKFRNLMQDTGDMRKHANHILEIATYRNVSIQHLEADVAELHRLSAKLHSLVDRNEEKRKGHVHGNTKRIHQMLAGLTSTVCTMQQQIQALKQPVYHGHGHYSQNVRPQPPVHRPQPQVHRQPSYAQPVYNQPVYNQPVYRAPVASYAPQTQCNASQPTRSAYTGHQRPIFSNRAVAVHQNMTRFLHGR